ncbi:hypothetical protein Nepgr_031994 [Nepenthes gracilis]|uniref:Subtilisin-like protease SBT4.15 n=1 Tax=Nepenthes gracilis TaxID=150966 RepID=A0AAD3Y7Z0_NEPGR|nr:hypothetical protein Nepgr_031994 [Nepenthes gracilis]
MGGLPPEVAGVTTTEQHHSLLAEAIGDEELARKAMIHSYRRSLSAFAANISPQEAKRLSEKSSVISVFPNTIRKLLTTRSWDFLGMPLDKTKRNRVGESNMIVATLDTGIYIEAPSFNDEGYGPPPAKWKGKCDNGANFTGCNNKVIGARFYNLNPGEDTVFPSPVDTEGHGTHTASIAAGGAVHGASLYGLARGTARGGVPSARIATYKVCGDLGCPDMNLLAAFDDAIADGVDVISVSISGSAGNFFDDVIAIGSFHAMQKGILTSCAAGNEGPYEGTVQNVAPWILTVAATNMDRQFRTPVKLGNGMKFSGLSINTYPPEKAMYPLISGALAANSSSDPYLNASTCDPGSLSIRKVKGKIVLCSDSSGAGYTIITSGGHGAIIAVDEEEDIAFTTLLPSTNINTRIGRQIAHYINTAKKATAVIYKSITMKANAPRIASFSSRGPQFVTRDILKPDIAAPGLDILAGYSKLASITNEAVDQRHMTFNIISGTSMATPHASGAAAYVKSFHPDWSQAAIKSALMTTAKPMIANGSHAPLDSGSGLLNPTAAVHPGLVYDMSLGSYVSYLCKEGYNGTTIGLLAAGKPHLKCSDFPQARGSDGLNYPSMHLQLLADDTDFSTVFHRTVTNVGYGNSTYKATVHAPKGVTVKAIPNRLVFGEQHQKRSFAVVVKGKLERGVHGSVSAVLEWDDSKHIVRSPILIYKPAI